MDWVEKAFYLLLLTAGFVCLSTVGYGMYEVVTSSGQVDYCYIDTSNYSKAGDDVILKGHRPWSNDARFGYFKTPEEAYEFANKIHCPILK